MRRRLGWIVLGLAAVAVVAVVALLTLPAPDVSGVGAACADDCRRFPTVTGANLPGETWALPAAFTGAPALVLLPLDEAQQQTAESWREPAQALAATVADLNAYNVPTFPALSSPVRLVIRAGLNVAITNAALREHTITLFLDDRDAFLTALDISDTDMLPVLLLNAEGDVVWRGYGAYTAGQGQALKAVLVALAG